MQHLHTLFPVKQDRTIRRQNVLFTRIVFTYKSHKTPISYHFKGISGTFPKVIERLLTFAIQGNTLIET